MQSFDPYFQVVFNSIEFAEITDYENVIDLSYINLLIRHLLYQEDAPDGYNNNNNLQWRIRNQKDNPLFKYIYESYGLVNTLKIMYACHRTLDPFYLEDEAFHLDMFLNPLKAGDLVITGAFIMQIILNITPQGKIRIRLPDSYSTKYRYLNKFNIRKYNVPT